MWRALSTVILAMSVVALACGAAAPTPTPTAAPASPGATAAPAAGATPTQPVAAAVSTPTPTTAPTPTVTASPSPEDEALRSELREGGFSPVGWRTNFRIHSVQYREFPFAIPKDAIPALDNPKFESVKQASRWLDDREPVQALNIKGDARAYPLQILIWHELVNDVVGGEPVLITY